MRVSLVAICALVLLSVAAQAADQYYIVNTTDVYQTWGTSLRSLYPASISSGRMIVAHTDNDAAGNVYVVGSVVGTFQGRTTLGPNSRDGVIMKFNSAGNPLWIRYVASFSDEAIEACTVDAAGNLLVAGWTTGSLLGQSFLGGSQDAFVAKFSSLGDQLWLYQFGTPSTDLAYGISVDPANNPVVFGNTNGQMGTTNYGGWDVFVAKFNADNGTSIWVQQFGTTSTDYAGLVLGQSIENIGRVVGVSQYGNIYFAYNTDGTVTASGSTPKGYQDVYVVKLSPTGGALWTVQIASAAADWATSLVVDVNGDLYVGGRTQGPIMGQLYAAGWDCFISKVSSQGQVVWTRTFGNRNDQEVDGMTLDSDGNVYAVGYSSSSTFDDEYDMTLNPDYTYNRYTPGYVTKLDLFGNRIWTRFFRSTHGPRSVYYSVTSTFPFTVTALPSPTGGSSTGLVVGGPYTGLFLSDDDTSFGDVTSYYASFLFRVTQTVNCTLDQYNSVLTDINNLFYSLGIN